MMKLRQFGVVVGISGVVGLLFLVTFFLHTDHDKQDGSGGASSSQLSEKESRDEAGLSRLKWQLFNGVQTSEKTQSGHTHSANHANPNPTPTEPCQVVDVAVVVGGYNATRTGITLVKSLLFYRTTSIHLHLIVDQPAKLTLSTLLQTWDIANFSVSFYEAEEVGWMVEWIANKHYSGIYGLMKLTLPAVLPLSLDRVIVLDTDVIFASDIDELWQLFDSFNSSQALGMVENMSDWYIGPTGWNEQKRWPALGRGFNSGVILMHLGKLRQMHWAKLWRSVAETVLPVMNATDLADQDIFNAVFKDHPHLVHTLPCIWNAQLSDHTKSDQLCAANTTGFKIIHWNSPKKMQVKHRLGRYYKNDYLTFVSHDGNLLRRGVLGCSQPGTEEKDNSVLFEDVCYDFVRLENLKFRTHLYYIDYAFVSSEPNDVTLVAQLSFDRLQMLEPLCAHWTGPMSVALYLSDAEAQQFAEFVSDSPELFVRRNVGYHIVYKDGAVYPVNYLRNVALSQANTPFVFLTDIDFLPMLGLYPVLKQTILQNNLIDQHTKVLVVAAFETQRYRYTFPANKSELLQQLSSGDVIAFRSDVWPKGHETSNYSRWTTATEPYTVEWVPDYEPYIVVSRDVPRYDQRFGGFGWNKVSHLMLLAVEGFEMVVLPDVFIIHMPHAPSLDIAKFRSKAQYRRCLNRLKQEFVRDLAKVHGRKATKYLIS